MNLLRGVVAIVLVSLLFGCASKPTNQPSQPSVSTEQNSSTQTQTAAPAPVPEQPKYLVPILLGKNKQEVIDLLGNPEQITKTNGLSSAWIYWAKPLSGIHIVLSFEKWTESRKVQKPQATVQQVTLENGTFQEEITPNMVIPLEIINEKPAGYLGYQEAVGIFWHLNGKTFLVSVTAASPGNKLYANESKMNLKTENLEITPRLTSAGSNWQSQHLFRFYQVNGSYSGEQLVYNPYVEIIKLQP